MPGNPRPNSTVSPCFTNVLPLQVGNDGAAHAKDEAGTSSHIGRIAQHVIVGLEKATGDTGLHLQRTIHVKTKIPVEAHFLNVGGLELAGLAVPTIETTSCEADRPRDSDGSPSRNTHLPVVGLSTATTSLVLIEAPAAWAFGWNAGLQIVEFMHELQGAERLALAGKELCRFRGVPVLCKHHVRCPVEHLHCQGTLRTSHWVKGLSAGVWKRQAHHRTSNGKEVGEALVVCSHDPLQDQATLLGTSTKHCLPSILFLVQLFVLKRRMLKHTLTALWRVSFLDFTWHMMIPERTGPVIQHHQNTILKLGSSKQTVMKASSKCFS